MLSLKDVQQYVYGLGIVATGHAYIGKLDAKQQRSIGIYHCAGSGPPVIALGGIQNSSYGICSISFLVHWNKNPVESEKIAHELYNKLLRFECSKMGDTWVDLLQLRVPEPVDVGTDEDGIYEYVIWLDLIYERED